MRGVISESMRGQEEEEEETKEKRGERGSNLPLESGFHRPLASIASKKEPLNERRVLLDVANSCPPNMQNVRSEKRDQR